METIQRLRKVFNPPSKPPKNTDALRFGLLGASNIAPIALINPALSHPDVIIAAVAARSIAKATAYAQKHSIPRVHASYQDLIEDPAIDVIYNPLPNGSHYEWTLKALQAGKHVLLEKPSTSNSSQAEQLFSSPLLKARGGDLVLLEAFHPLFHPAFQAFLDLIGEKQYVEKAEVVSNAPRYIFGGGDIRFSFAQAGGALMDMGCYNILALRSVFGGEPVACISAEGRGVREDCEEAFSASWGFENGGVGSIDVDLRRGVRGFGGFLAWVPWSGFPVAKVVLKEVVSPAEKEGLEVGKKRVVRMANFIGPGYWHRVDVEDVFTIRNVASKKVVKEWREKNVVRAYSWGEEGKKGEDWWTTYRYQLDAFVDRVRGGEGGLWMEGNDSVKQMKMVDGAYEKAGLRVREGGI